jgi:hypothetical protein
LQWLAPSQRERIRYSHRRKAAAARTLTRRAGPALPSYLALHHAGFSVPRVLPHERWALTPPFHPYQRNELCEDVTQVFLRDATVPFRRRYILCGTFRERTGRRGPKPALPKSLPWRYQARCPYLTSAVKRMNGSLMTQDGVRTFLPSSHLAMARPAITRPARRFHYSF